jgi:hypothetical protein
VRYVDQINSRDTVDTHGLVAQIKVSEEVMISPDGEFFGGYCYTISPGETFRFNGKLHFGAKSTGAYIYIVYFDAV